MIIASEAAVKKHGLKPVARIIGMASAGVPPRVMGIGPVPSTRKLMERYGLQDRRLRRDRAERGLRVAGRWPACGSSAFADDAEHVNPNGGAIALGHPLGMSGARLALTAAHRLVKQGGKRALATMCVGVGQGSLARARARLSQRQSEQGEQQRADEPRLHSVSSEPVKAEVQAAGGRGGRPQSRVRPGGQISVRAQRASTRRATLRRRSCSRCTTSSASTRP